MAFQRSLALLVCALAVCSWLLTEELFLQFAPTTGPFRGSGAGPLGGRSRWKIGRMEQTGLASLCLAMSSGVLLGLVRRFQAPSGAKARPQAVEDTRDPETQVAPWEWTPGAPSEPTPRQWRTPETQKLPQRPRTTLVDDTTDPGLRPQQMFNWGVGTPYHHPQADRLLKDLAFLCAHAGALFAPFYFTGDALACFLVLYPMAAMCEMALSCQRQLPPACSRSRKLVEYFIAYCGVLTMQSHLENGGLGWRRSGEESDEEQSDRQQNHQQPQQHQQSQKGGSWWLRRGWLFDEQDSPMRLQKMDASDRYFYMFLRKTYYLHAVVVPVAGLYLYGGLPFVFWGFFVRVVAQQPACLRDLLPARAK